MSSRSFTALRGNQLRPTSAIPIDLDDELECGTASTALAADLSEEAAIFRSSVNSGRPGAVGSELKRGRPPKRKAEPLPVSVSEGDQGVSSAFSSTRPEPIHFEVSSSDVQVIPDNADNSAEERWFLGMGTKVVGVQHYSGVVSDRENVVLRRQPSNAYDRNAIQVLNIRNEQIGHLPREICGVLAPLMDSLSSDLSPSSLSGEVRFEGHIPRGSGNVFSMPLRLQVYATDPNGNFAPRFRDVGERLRRIYCAAARGGVEVLSSPDQDGTPVSNLDDQTLRSIMGGKPPKKLAAPQGPPVSEVIERELEVIYRTGVSYENSPEAHEPEALRTDLFPHQRKALYWMLQKERLLTVEQALAEAPTNSPAAAFKSCVSKSQTSKVPKATDPLQWFFWTKETLPNGSCIYKNLATNSAFRESPSLPRGGILADDMGLGKTITMLALMLSDSKRATAAASHMPALGRNLVVCPLTVLCNWAEQIRFHAPSLRVRTYHGPDRDREPRSFALHDVILTTYDIVRAEAKDKTRGLGAVNWHRAVLDEAHVIKSHRTATSKAVSDLLVAERRWCLTGTPIQNSIEDLFALSRFLRLEPFDQFEWFNRTIARPLKIRDVVGLERLQVLLRMWCLRRTKDMSILDPATGAPRPLLSLPQKTVEVVRVPLDPADRVFYDRLFNCVREQVEQLEKKSQLGEQFSQILALLTRLRQLCCSSRLLPEGLLVALSGCQGEAERILAATTTALGSIKVDELLKNLSDAQEDDCSICLIPGCDTVTRCGHVFHRACIEVSIQELGRGGSGACPLCRRPVQKTELLEKPEQLEVVENLSGDEVNMSSSAKVRSIVSFLLGHVVGKVDPDLQKPHKAIVFSQFTSLLGLVQKELERNSTPLVRLDGSMSYDKRVHALQSFSSHPHIQVILCSLKAAGTGLNMTVANHVLLIDPWWNPMVEDQAIDRAHRLGQRRPVRAIRFVAERTVEERILAVHAQKRAIVDGALSFKTREQLQKMRLEMMASIFEPF